MSTSELLLPLCWSWTDCLALDRTYHSWNRGPREYLIRFLIVIYQPSCWRTAFCACAGIKSKMSVSIFLEQAHADQGLDRTQNTDNLNKQVDLLGSRIDLGFQSITQRLSDIRVVSPERAHRNSGNNYSFSARSSPQSLRRDQNHSRCFYCNEFGHFQAVCPKRSPGRFNRSHSLSRYQTSGGKKESNCWGLLTVANLQSHVLMAAQLSAIVSAKIIYGGMNYFSLMLLVHMQAVQMNL